MSHERTFDFAASLSSKWQLFTVDLAGGISHLKIVFRSSSFLSPFPFTLGAFSFKVLVPPESSIVPWILLGRFGV